MMNGADLLIECLSANGVTTLFGMPGGQTVGIYDALYRHGRIRHVLVRNEHAGCFMADGYARASGRPGVCLVTAGPGLTNCLTGLGTAYSDSVPLLLISGQIPREAVGKSRGFFHEMDHLGVTARLTKWNAPANSAAEIPTLVQRAFQEMLTGRPRPVHLDVPVDVSREETTSQPLPFLPPEIPAPDPRHIAQAADVLLAARRPLIIAGGGVTSARAGDELLELAQVVGAPILTTPMGKDCVPADHPSVAGMLFHKTTSDLSGMKEHLSALTRHSDAVLAVGCRFSQLATGNWALEVPADLVQMDIDPDEIGRNYPVRVGICAHAKVALPALTRMLRGRGSSEAGGNWRSVRAQLPQQERWHIEGFDVVPILRRVLNRDAIVTCDITRLYYMMLSNLPLYQPRTFLHSSCFIAMGYGLPAAIGAKVAFPDRQVVAIAGDGGFLMTAQELACAVQEQLAVVTVVINDNCLSAMKGIQNRWYDGRHIAVDLVNPDFTQFAESFGALGLRVRSVNEFEPALRSALRAERPSVIEIQAPQTPV
jgi:acetolactate synthase-1/2/3 large subunit